MSDLQAIADRVEIEALRGEFADAGMTRDYDRFAARRQREQEADHATSTTRLLQFTCDCRDELCRREPNLHLQPRALRQRVEWLEALDGHAGKLVTGTLVELDGEKPASASAGSRFDRGTRLVIEDAGLELAR